MPDHLPHKTHVYPLLDALRGVAALIVVAYHTREYLGFQVARGYLAVDFFFVLSGVVVANAYEAKLVRGMPLRSFAAIRLIRLYPLFALGMVLGFGASLMDGAAPSGPLHGLGALLIGLAMLPRLWPLHPAPGQDGTLYPLNNPSWSLFFEIVVNLGYALIVRRLTTRWLVWIMAVSWIACVAFVVLSHAEGLSGGWRPAQMPLGLARTCFSFFAGVAIYRAFVARGAPLRAVKGRAGQAASAILAGVVALSLLWSGGGVAFDLAVVTFLFPSVVAAALHISVAGRLARAFGFAGMASYAIYILHVPCYELTRAAGFASLGPGYAELAFLALMVALAALVNRVFDVPVRKFLSQLRAGRSTSMRGAPDLRPGTKAH